MYAKIPIHQNLINSDECNYVYYCFKLNIYYYNSYNYLIFNFEYVFKIITLIINCFIDIIYLLIFLNLKMIFIYFIKKKRNIILTT